MSTADRYVEQVLRRIWAAPERGKRLEADLRSHFAQGQARGESESEIVARLGSPEEVAEAFMADVELDYAGFFERVFAFLADFGLLFTLLIPFAVAAVLLSPQLEEVEGGVVAISMIAAAAVFTLGMLGLFVFYFPLLEGRFGKTLGKHLMQLQVRTEAGARISLGAAFLRRLSLYFEILVLDSLFVPFTAKRQRAFDIVAETVVVREPGAKRGAVRYLYCLVPWVLPALVMIAFALAQRIA